MNASNVKLVSALASEKARWNENVNCGLVLHGDNKKLVPEWLYTGIQVGNDRRELQCTIRLFWALKSCMFWCMLGTPGGPSKWYCWLIETLRKHIDAFAKAHIYTKVNPNARVYLLHNLLQLTDMLFRKQLPTKPRWLIKARYNWLLLQYINTSQTNLNVNIFSFGSLWPGRTQR